MTIEATLYRVQIKMPKPFGHARAVRSEGDGLVFTVELDGVSGIGECVPRDYVTGETVEAAIAAIRRLDLGAIGAQLNDLTLADGVAVVESLRLPDLLTPGARPGMAAACAVELALLDVLAKRASVPLSAVAEVIGIPSALRRRPDASQPIPLSRAWDFLGKLADLSTPFRPDHLKLKGGAEIQFDVERARAVRELFGDTVTMSIDANMSWSLDEAIERVEVLRPYNVSWFEEPLAQYALADYRTLRERTGARVMLDESLCSFDDGRRAVEAGACDLFNIRISKNGGLLGSLRLAELAHQHGLGMQLGVHPGQMGVLGAAGAQFLSIVGPLDACEGGDVFIGGGNPERIIQEQLRLDARTGRCEGLGSQGLGVTSQLATIERHATQRTRWTDGRWLDA